MTTNKTLRDYNNEDDYGAERIADLINDYDEDLLNEAAIYFNDNGMELVVAYGDNKTISIELNTEEERAVVQMVLSDANFWTAFLGALGQAMKKKMEQDIGE